MGATSKDIDFDNFENSNFEFFKGLLDNLDDIKIVDVEDVLNGLLKLELEVDTNIFSIPEDVNWDVEADLLFNNETGALRALLQADDPDTEYDESDITNADFGRFFDVIVNSTLVNEDIFEVMVEFMESELYHFDSEYSREAIKESTLKYASLIETNPTLTWEAELTNVQLFLDAYYDNAPESTLAELAANSVYLSDYYN